MKKQIEKEDDQRKKKEEIIEIEQLNQFYTTVQISLFEIK